MKYKDSQGNFQDIYIKVGDNIPVGGEMDFDGDDIPVGWEEVNNVVELYNNSSGIQDNIPLNDNYTNYTYLEIFGYTNNDGTIYKKITTDRNTFELSTLLPIVGNPIIQMYTNIYSLNGTNITLTRYLRNNANNNQPNTISESNGIYITKIIGYK